MGHPKRLKQMDNVFENTSFIGPAEYLVFLAALLAYREESSNGVNGIRGVLHVLRNRTTAGFGDGDIFKVMTEPGAFASMSNRGDSQTIVYPYPTNPLFTRALQIAPEILQGGVEDITQGALYYADLNNKTFTKGGWFAENIVSHPERYPRLAVIGSTTFFGDRKVK
jgi:Cell Wall Hydrolase